MFNLSGSEIVVILLLALVVLGPEKLPDAIRRFGRTYGELKRMSSSFQDEMRSTIEEPMREMRETANLLREQADFTQYTDDKPKSGNPMEAGLSATAAVQSTAAEHDLDPVLAAERDSALAGDDGPDHDDDSELDEYEGDAELDDDFDEELDDDLDDLDDDLEDDFDDEPTVFADGSDDVSADEAVTGDEVADTSSSEQGDSGHNTP